MKISKLKWGDRPDLSLNRHRPGRLIHWVRCGFLLFAGLVLTLTVFSPNLSYGRDWDDYYRYNYGYGRPYYQPNPYPHGYYYHPYGYFPGRGMEERFERGFRNYPENFHPREWREEWWEQHRNPHPYWR